MKSVKRVLVTGGAGFIGSHLCERLVERGDNVVCYDNLDPYYDPEKKRRNIAGLQNRRDSRFQFVFGDILQSEKLEGTLREFEISHIVHLAARAGVRPSVEDPALYQKVNVVGTTHVLEGARKAGLRSVIVASSSSVYGANTKIPFHEEDPVTLPISPYAASKRAAELAASVHAHLYEMDILCHRFFTVYGPRQRPDMAIHQFVHKIQNGQPITMYGDGTSRRDYTYVEDIVSGLIASVDKAPGMGFQIFNLGNSQTVELGQLIAAIGAAVGRKPEIIQKPEQPGDVKKTYADVEKARRMLGYHPTTSIHQGLAKYVAWLKAQDAEEALYATA